MKKLMLLMMIVLLVGTVSAFEFDNVKNYNETDRSITVKNSFIGIPLDEVAVITPLTPHINKVMVGNNRLVAEFEIDSKGIYTEGVFDGMAFFEVRKDNNEIQRNFTIKYLEKIEEIISPIMETTCKGEELEDCTTFQTGTTTSYSKVWTELDTEADLPKGKITIGLFADVYKNDYIEFIPEWFGIKMSEYAVWEEYLNENLIAYYALEEQAAQAVGDTAPGTVYNGTSEGIGYTQSGIIGDMYDFAEVTDDINLSGIIDGAELTENFSVSFWFKKEGAAPSAVDHIFHYVHDSSDPEVGVRAVDATTYTFRAVSGGVVWNLVVPFDDNGNWVHVVITKDAGGSGTAKLYVNGLLNQSDTSADTTPGIWDSTVHTWGATMDYGAGSPVSGVIMSLDEIAYFNITINGTTVAQLYNGGSGITHTTDFNNPPVVQLNLPTNATNQTSSSVLFNCSGTDDLGLTNITLLIDHIVNTTVFNTTAPQNLSIETTLNVADGMHNWTCEARDAENKQGTTELRAFGIDTGPPEFTATGNITNLIGEVTFPTISSWNFTVTDPNLASCWHNSSDNATVEIVTCNSAAINTEWATSGTKTLFYYANDSLGNENYSSSTINVNYEINKFNYTTFEMSEEEFRVNVTYDNVTYSTIAANLWYNGTEYTGTLDGTADQVEFSSTIEIPQVTSNGNKSFYWQVAYDGVNIVNTTLQNQTVHRALLGICNSTLVTPILNITFKNETILPEDITALLAPGHFAHWISPASANKTFIHVNATENTNYPFCTNVTTRDIKLFVDLTYQNSESPQRAFENIFFAFF